jgi:hypothetical protein
MVTGQSAAEMVMPVIETSLRLRSPELVVKIAHFQKI